MVDVLRAGRDSPALRTLAAAAMSNASSEELAPLVEHALAELGMRKPSPRDAVLYTARESAGQILRGDVSPYEGSKRIWDLTLLVPGEVITELDPFIYAASEWEERLEERHLFEKSIVQEAEALSQGAKS